MSGILFLRRGGDDGAWRAHFIEQLKRLEQLPAGSDSWSAHRPSPEVFKAAVKVADDAGSRGAFVSLVTATSEGAIQLKWQNSAAEFSLFLYPNHSAEYIFLSRDRSKRDSGDVPDIGRAGEIVSHYFPR